MFAEWVAADLDLLTYVTKRQFSPISKTGCYPNKEQRRHTESRWIDNQSIQLGVHKLNASHETPPSRRSQPKQPHLPMVTDRRDTIPSDVNSSIWSGIRKTTHPSPDSVMSTPPGYRSTATNLVLVSNGVKGITCKNTSTNGETIVITGRGQPICRDWIVHGKEDRRHYFPQTCSR